MVGVRFTTDPTEAWDVTRPLLENEPVANNVICTLLAQRSATGRPIRCWFTDRGGVVFQSPESFPAVLSTMSPEVAAALAEEVASVGVPGATGLARDAAVFAGAYATASRQPAQPVEGQRIYEIRAVRPPRGVDGRMRGATAADVDLLTGWIEGFSRDTGDQPDIDARTRATAIVGAGRYWIWETADGDPVSSALTAPSTLGVVRVGGVYTPPDHRGHGFAAAVVAALSSATLAAGDRVILYTQLQNPTSNGVYQRSATKQSTRSSDTPLVDWLTSDSRRSRTAPRPCRTPAAGPQRQLLKGQRGAHPRTVTSKPFPSFRTDERVLLRS